VNWFLPDYSRLSICSQIAEASNHKLCTMSAKYYTHFIAQSEDAIEYNEYRGVVELLGQAARVEGDRDIARMLARSFDLDETDIQVLQWHQLH
jgi:predicted amidophosphoribosyltransferase